MNLKTKKKIASAVWVIGFVLVFTGAPSYDGNGSIIKVILPSLVGVFMMWIAGCKLGYGGKRK